ELSTLVDAALSGGVTLCPITRVDADGQEVHLADGTEQSVTLRAQIDGQAVSWTERRLLVRSRAAQVAQTQAMEQRLVAAEAALAELLLARRGKARPATPADAEAAVATILERYQVSGLLAVSIQATAHTRTLRPYRGQAARQETTYDLRLSSTRSA